MARTGTDAQPSLVNLTLRARRGEQLAVFDLADRCTPASITELVQRVYPTSTPTGWQFDALADGYHAWQHRPRGD